MKSSFLLGCTVVILFSSCTKSVNSILENTPAENPATAAGKVLFTIKQGQQYCDKNYYQLVNIHELKFKVTFDSSAIYTTSNASNQCDINKLYGFSDNNAMHQQFSARFGWRWYNNALEIFAYVYNNGVVSFVKVGNAFIAGTQNYSIKVLQECYVFALDNVNVTMPRASATAAGTGYKLYPYFGGDELAPHDVRIWIEEL